MADFTPHEAPAHEAQALPVMLPSKHIGRDRVLAKVYEHLRDNMPVLLYGPAGVGKTTLAGMLASAYTDLPGGVLWLHLHDPDLAELLVTVGRAYDEPDISTRENPLAMVGAVANTLTAHKPLIVLDGSYEPEVAQEFISRCADGLPVLLLADEQIVGPWAAVALTKLEPAQAATLFKHLTAGNGSDSEATDADIDQLVAALDSNPFALTVAAGAVIAAKQAPGEFLENLPRQAGVAGPLLALTSSFRSLNSALQGLVLMLGATFNGEASNDLLSLMSGAPAEGIRQAMLLLVQRGLVQRFQRYNSTYYRLHPIVHAFTQPLLRGSHKLDSLRAKVRDTLLSYASANATASAASYNKLAVEMDSLMALARWAADDGDLDTVRQLTTTLSQAGDFVQERGYVYELLTLQRLAASSTSAFPAYADGAPAPLPYEDVEEEDDEAEAEAAPVAVAPAAPLPLDEPDADDDDLIDEDEEEDDGSFYPTLPYDLLGEDEYDEDDEDEDDDDAPVMTSAPLAPLPLDVLADEDEDDEPDEGEPEAEADEADETPEAEPQPETEPETPEPPELARLRVSLSQARQQGNQHRQAELLSQMGQTLVAADMENEAIASFSEALAVYEELEDRSGILRTLETLAALTARTENSQAAVLHATRGVQVAEQTGDKARQMHLLSILGDARQQLGETEQAIGAYNLALDSAREQQNSAEEAQILLRLGYAQLDDARAQAAIASWEAALTLFKEQGKRDLEGRVLGGLGTAYGELGRWTEAIAFHTAALFIAREVGDRDEEALQLSNLGYASVQAQQLGQAVLRYRQALHLAYQAKNRDNIVSMLTDLVNLLVESPRHLRIAELLADEALKQDPNDRNVKRLKERVEDEIQAATENGVQWTPVSGSVQDYAANAYQLLDG